MSFASQTRVAATSLALLGSLTACATDDVLSPARLPQSVAESRSTPTCPPDSKLIGRIEISGEDRPGTWWYITREGMDKSGLTDYEAVIENWFGVEFADLNEAIAALLVPVSGRDENGNGFICAYEVRGTLANYGDPNINNLLFTTRDDFQP